MPRKTKQKARNSEPPSTIESKKKEPAPLAPETTETTTPPGPAEELLDKIKSEASQPDEAVEQLKRLMHGIKTGEDISQNEPIIARLINNQEARAKIINSLLLTHDYDRLLKYVEVRRNLDRILIDYCSKTNLTALEATSIYKLVSTEMDEITGKLRAQMTGAEDILNLITKVNWATSMSDEALQGKFANTSPQARELIRKFAYRMSQATKAPKKDDKKKK